MALRLAACLPMALGIEVLYVGAPKTGTQTMHSALRRLGYSAGHTGYDRSLRRPLNSFLFEGGPVEPVEALLRRFDTLLDEPSQFLYTEALRLNPNCKFVIAAPHPGRWFTSYAQMVRRYVPDPARVPVSFRLPDVSPRGASNASRSDLLHQSLGGLPFASTHGGFHDAARYFGCAFQEAVQTPALERRCLEGFQRHYANVRRLVPPDRLLVLNFSDGWRPLCEFLGKPLPQEPFPYEDRFKVAPALV